MYSPTLPEFVALAAKGKPYSRHVAVAGGYRNPLWAYRKIRGPGEAFLFESVEGGEHRVAQRRQSLRASRWRLGQRFHTPKANTRRLSIKPRTMLKAVALAESFNSV
jgi:hypothetical protein